MKKLNIDEMLEIGKLALQDNEYLLQSARNVRREVTIRLARRLMDLQTMPFLLVANPHISAVYDLYQLAFVKLRDSPEVVTMADEAALTALLQELIELHLNVIPTLARGIGDCRQKPALCRQIDVNGFVDTFMRTRVSRRVLAEHHICLHLPREGYIGAICTHLSLATCIKKMSLRCSDVAYKTYGQCPEIEISGQTLAC